jgi:haloacetate dehalogenase
VTFFAGFEESRVGVGDGVALRVRTGGSGPPVVLLHGHPRTHTTWHRVAPLQVAAGHTVVCPDLRGYGRSSKPAPAPDHSPHSKRAMAGDVVALMRRLGHERFAVVGHDRGSYVAMRTALDHPDAVTHLAVLDSVPIAEALDRADGRFASAWWHCKRTLLPPTARKLAAGPCRRATPGTAPPRPGR